MPRGVYQHKTNQGFQKRHKSGMTGKHHTQKTKEKIRKRNIGKIVSKETREKLSESHEGNYHSEITKQKMKDNNWMKKHRGEKSPHWLDGKSFDPYSVDWTETLKRSIRERDHYICQLCLKYGNTVHHIDYDKKNCNPDNLITLCISCNSKVNKNRDYWKSYFTTRTNPL